MPATAFRDRRTEPRPQAADCRATIASPGITCRVATSSESIQTVHPERKIVVDKRGDATGLFDSDRMLQVFGNLLDNAAAYGAAGTPIDIVLEQDGDAAVVRVHNSGEPIPADALAAIFEPFRRGASKANRSGVGLGLFIVREIVAGQR